MTEIETSSVNGGVGPAITFAQNRFEGAFKTCEDESRNVNTQLKRLKLIAYALKGIAIFGGLALTTGLPEVVSQLIGIAISAAIAFDTWLSNHRRLLSRATAQIAYRRLLSSVEHKHTNDLQELLPMMQAQPVEFAKGLIDLLTKLRSTLHTTGGEIKDALSNADLEALRKLALENEKKAS